MQLDTTKQTNCVCVCARVHVLSRVRLFATLWTGAHQAPLSMEFSRQEYWSGLLFPSPEDLLDPRTEPMSLVSAALADRFFATSTTWGTPNEVRGEGKSWGVF